jgi:basic membrane protein A and related proteins
MRKFVGDTVLTSPVWNWGVYYIDTVRKGMEGTWKSDQYWQGLSADVVRLADYSPLVPQDVRDLVEAQKAKIVSGSWDVFTGPIKDNTGALKVKEGEKMDDGALLSFDWLVAGVVGKVK